MVECFFTPDSISVEHEQLFAFHVSENHVLIKFIYCPHELGGNVLMINLLQVLDINIDPSHSTEKGSLVENNLLRVGEELRVISEVVHVCQLSGERDGHSGEGQESKPLYLEGKASGKHKHVEVVYSSFDQSVSFVRFIKEHAVLGGFHTGETTVVSESISCPRVKECLEELQNE